MVLIVFILKSFNLIIERFGSFENIKKKNQLSGFQFSPGNFHHFSMPKRETADNFVMLKNLASQLMVLLKVKKSLWWHVQEVMSESFGAIGENLLSLKRFVGIFGGRKGV